MTNKLLEKLKNPFFKELLLATILFCLPFLLWVHVLFNEDTATQFKVFGLVITHSWPNDALYIWYAILVLLLLLYSALYYFLGRDNIKVLMIVFMMVFTRDFISYVFLLYEGPKVSYWLISSFLTIVVFTLLFKLNKLPKPSFTSLFKAKLALSQKCWIFLLGTCFIFWFGDFWLPKGRESLDFIFIRIGTFGFASVDDFLWLFSTKLLFLLIVLIWFFTERKWWKYALLSPIFITAYQLRTILFTESEFIDEIEVFQALPFLGLVLIVLLALSKNAREQYLFQAIYQKTYARFEEKHQAKWCKKQEVITQVKAKLETLKTAPHKKDMEELLELKRQLEQKLLSNK